MRRRGKFRVGSYVTCEHPESWLYYPRWDDLGEPIEEMVIRCAWCGRMFRSKAAARRERMTRWSERNG